MIKISDTPDIPGILVQVNLSDWWESVVAMRLPRGSCPLPHAGILFATIHFSGWFSFTPRVPLAVTEEYYLSHVVLCHLNHPIQCKRRPCHFPQEVSPNP